MIEQIYIPFIPEVRKYLSAAEYEVFALCYALDERGKTIFFSNAYLSKLLNKSKRAISGIFEKIEKKGFIKRILSAAGRTIEIVKSKFATPCKKLHGACTKQHTTPMKKTSSNNIVLDNRINKEDTPSVINKYFEEISSEYDVETKDMADIFINKHLSGSEYKKNIGNWKGKAKNFFKYWLKNEAKRGSEPRKLASWEITYRKFKNTTQVKYDGTIYQVENAQIKFESGDYPLGKLIKKWYAENQKFELQMKAIK